MKRRCGQSGCVSKKGSNWRVRFYVDIPGVAERQRKSLTVGPCAGPNKLTKAEAVRRGSEIVNSLGVNSPEHLERSLTPVTTFEQRVKWCQQFHKAWVHGKPSTLKSMDSQLSKHILPRFGAMPLDAVTETAVQEFASDLARATFKHRVTGKSYKLSRKTILNVIGLVKLLLGKKVWLTWTLNLGDPEPPDQPYFTEEQLQQIVTNAEGQYKALFALLAGTGMRAGEVAGLHVEDLDLANGVIYVRRSVWGGREITPKTKKGIRQIDIDPALSDLLKAYLGDRKIGRVFSSRNGSPIADGNIRKRVLHPLLKRLGIPKAGLHAFRHGRVTILRKRGTPGDLQKQWIGHSSLQTTDIYSHTHQELEYRRQAASNAALNLVVGTHGTQNRSAAA
jgi:integrase